MRPIKLFAFLLGLLIAAPLYAPLPARATILFAGGEDIDYTTAGATTIDTSAGEFRSGWSRYSTNVFSTSTSDPIPVRVIGPVVANQSTFWVHAVAFTGVANGTLSGTQVMAVYGSDGVRRLMVRGTGTNNTVKISTRNTAGTITDLVTCSAVFPTGVGTVAKLDWFINYAVAGHTTLYLNGTQFCDYAGDITTNSITAINRADFGATGVSPGISWSELIFSTTDTRGLGVFTCYPSANGVNMTWNGAYTNVNPNTANDASAINTGSNTQSALFTCPALPAGTYSVPAVTQTARVTVGSSGPQNFYFMARPATGSTDYNNGATTLGTTAFLNYQNVWLTNPATSSAWVPADVTTGVNFGIQSQP